MPFSATRCIVTVAAVALGVTTVLAADRDHGGHDHVHGPASPAVGDNATVYTCNLIEGSGQCRTYPIAEGEEAKADPLRKGCESMGGSFQQGHHCPDREKVDRCVNITYNPHDPESVIYTNHYYPEEKGKWSSANVKRVCGNLDGRFRAPETHGQD